MGGVGYILLFVREGEKKKGQKARARRGKKRTGFISGWFSGKEVGERRSQNQAGDHRVGSIVSEE